MRWVVVGRRRLGGDRAVLRQRPIRYDERLNLPATITFAILVSFYL